MSFVGFADLSSQHSNLAVAEQASLREAEERRQQAVELIGASDAPNFTIVLVETAMALTLDQLPAALQDREFFKFHVLKPFFESPYGGVCVDYLGRNRTIDHKIYYPWIDSLVFLDLLGEFTIHNNEFDWNTMQAVIAFITNKTLASINGHTEMELRKTSFAVNQKVNALLGLCDHAPEDQEAQLTLEIKSLTRVQAFLEDAMTALFDHQGQGKPEEHGSSISDAVARQAVMKGQVWERESDVG